MGRTSYPCPKTFSISGQSVIAASSPSNGRRLKWMRSYEFAFSATSVPTADWSDGGKA